MKFIAENTKQAISLQFLTDNFCQDDNFHLTWLSLPYSNGCKSTGKQDLENSADPDQMPQNVASDQGLHLFATHPATCVFKC